jgi:hypothetical protein
VGLTVGISDFIAFTFVNDSVLGFRRTVGELVSIISAFTLLGLKLTEGRSDATAFTFVTDSVLGFLLTVGNIVSLLFLIVDGY